MGATSSLGAAPEMGDANPAAFAQGEPRPATPPTPGVLEEVSRVAAAAHETFSSFLHLVTLEAQRAGVALVWMVVSAIAAALLVATGWVGLMAAVAMGAMLIGVPPITAVVAVALFNLAAAGGLVYLCIGMSRALLFPATQRQLAGKSPTKPTSP